MDLPRFTSGEVGRLTYAHLNEAFELLDKLRPLLISASEGGLAGEEFVFARITAEADDNGLHEWKEVVPSFSTSSTARLHWITRDGGRQSKPKTDPAFAPAIVPPAYISEGSADLPAKLAINTVVLLRAIKKKGGVSVWMVVSSVTKSDLFPAKIVAAYPLGGAGSQGVFRWEYDWDEVTPGTWTSFSDARKGRKDGSQDYQTARNGAEQDNITGAGGFGPSQATIVNAPIASGICVMMQMSGSAPWFSLGNTLTVNCGG